MANKGFRQIRVDQEAIKKGSAKGKSESVGSLTEAQIREIAEIKLPDLNAYDVESAIKQVKGTAINMGVEIKQKVFCGRKMTLIK